MPKPLWKWRYEQKEELLLALYRGLSHLEPRYITNELEEFDLHPMDFWTGDTDPSFIPYFFPDTETSTTSKIANTNINPEDPVDDPFTWAREMKSHEGLDSHKLHHALYAAFSKYLRKSPGGKHQSAWWDTVS